MAEQRHPDPLLRVLDAPLRATFHPLGFRLEIETNDIRVLDCAESAFGIFRQDEFSADPMRMRLLRTPGAASTPPWAPAAYRAWGDLLAVVCGPDNFLTADPSRKEAMGFFSPAMLDDREFFRWTFLEFATYMILEQHYLTPIHASCVVRDGQGICLCGPPGAGKTSLAYFCARSGYSLLADDVVFLLRSQRTPLLFGNPSRLHFPVSAREVFPELRSVPVGIRRDGDQFLAIPAEQLLPGRPVTQAEPGAVVFLDRSPEPIVGSVLEPVPASEAHEALLGARSVPRDEQLRAGHSDALWRLVGEGAYRLRYSALEEARRQLEGLPLRQRMRE